MDHIKSILKRLRNPTIVLSHVSQTAALCLLLGAQFSENAVMKIASSVCTILVTLGIRSSPDINKPANDEGGPEQNKPAAGNRRNKRRDSGQESDRK